VDRAKRERGGICCCDDVSIATSSYGVVSGGSEACRSPTVSMYTVCVPLLGGLWDHVGTLASWMRDKCVWCRRQLQPFIAVIVRVIYNVFGLLTANVCICNACICELAGAGYRRFYFSSYWKAEIYGI